MNSLKELAHNQMLEEMKEEHTPAEHEIHNWLCKQDDEELLKGIIEKNKSIKESMRFCVKKARDIKNDGVAVTTDQTVFDWVKEYYTTETEEIEEISVEVATAKEEPPEEELEKEERAFKIIPTKKEKEQGQMSLFDLI